MKDIFSDVVEWSWQKFRYDAANPRTQDDANWYSRLTRLYQPITHEKELRALLPTNAGAEKKDLFDTKHVMVLEMISEGDTILPFLTMNYVFGPGDGKVWIQMGLFCLDSSAEESFSSIGYRIEPPEEPGDSARSNHDYYHVQPIRTFRRKHPNLPQCPPWFPDVWPTWPLHARSPIQAFLSALVGLYGLRAIKNLLAENGLQSSTRKAIAEYALQISQESFANVSARATVSAKQKKK